MVENGKPKVIYTIMPDFAGAYGWVIRDGDESQGVGPNHACSHGWYGDHPISDGLQQSFADWQGRFEAGTFSELDAQGFDWEGFHAHGIELCHRLKAELGDAVRIIYEKPYEDPGRDEDERREILASGSLLNLPGRLDVYRVRLSRLLTRIMSGGQSGADRAALDWAIAHGIAHGGWCPPGRLAEDGTIDARYDLREVETGGYRGRTRRNVQDSDGTLILNLGEMDGGTLETQRFAERLRKPLLVLQLDDGVSDEWTLHATRWLRAYAIKNLNIAGPRASKRPGIYAAVTSLLDLLDQGYDPPHGTANGNA